MSSRVANATTTNQVALLDFSAGFAGSTNKLTYNGSATINGTKAELTNGGNNQAGSVFSTSAVDVTKFNSQFTFQLRAGSSTADGFTFCIQGNTPTALGPSGGGLGYGPDHTGGTGGIINSMAVKFDLYNNQGEGVDSTGLYTGGVAPTNVGSIDLTPSGVLEYVDRECKGHGNEAFNNFRKAIVKYDVYRTKTETDAVPLATELIQQYGMDDESRAALARLDGLALEADFVLRAMVRRG